MFGMGVIIPLLSGKIGKKTLAPMNIMSLTKWKGADGITAGKTAGKHPGSSQKNA